MLSMNPFLKYEANADIKRERGLILTLSFHKETSEYFDTRLLVRDV